MKPCKTSYRLSEIDWLLRTASITLLSTHWPETNQVLMKNRRIGISQSGIIDAFVKHGKRAMLEWSDNGYEYLRQMDKVYSDWLCIPKSIKITTTKPSGTVSLLPGVSPGIHYPHSEYYIRRVRIASDSPLIEIMRSAGYPIEFSQYGSEEIRKKTSIISFPIHEEFFDKKKEDVSIWEQVKNVVDYQKYWADNSVSCTVTFNKKEAKDIPTVLSSYEDELKAISFLPLENNGSYVQMPYEEITKETYEEMVKKIVEISFDQITTEAVGEKYCSNDQCTI